MKPSKCKMPLKLISPFIWVFFPSKVSSFDEDLDEALLDETASLLLNIILLLNLSMCSSQLYIRLFWIFGEIILLPVPAH